MEMKAITVAMREGIIKRYEQGKSTDEIAAFWGYCVAAVPRVRQQFKVRGTLESQTHLFGNKTLLAAPRQARLQQLVTAQPDATQAELGGTTGSSVSDFENGFVATAVGVER